MAERCGLQEPDCCGKVTAFIRSIRDATDGTPEELSERKGGMRAAGRRKLRRGILLKRGQIVFPGTTMFV
jgi:hypothetical protein